MADAEHGPLALQAALHAGCLTMVVGTGASFVRTGDTDIVVDRLPTRTHFGESDDNVRALAVFMEAIEQAQALDRHGVRDRVTEEFDTDRIVDSIMTAVNIAALVGGIETTATAATHASPVLLKQTHATRVTPIFQKYNWRRPSWFLTFEKTL